MIVFASAQLTTWKSRVEVIALLVGIDWLPLLLLISNQPSYEAIAIINKAESISYFFAVFY